MLPIYEIRRSCCGLGHGTLGCYTTSQEARENQPKARLMATDIVPICTKDELEARFIELSEAYVIQSDQTKHLVKEEARWRYACWEAEDKLRKCEDELETQGWNLEEFYHV